MVKQARELVRTAHLGEIRKIVVEYPQGWLSQLVEGESKQASWRTDPKQAGVSSASATSAPTPKTSRTTSPAWTWPRCAPT